MEAELRAWVKERGVIRAALTRFRNFFRDSANNTAVGSVKKRWQANVQLYDSFNKVQTKIEMAVIGSDAEAVHASERELFETTYFDLINEVETHIEKLNTSNQRGTSVSPASTSHSIVNIKLPTMQLPSFDGNYSDWLKFRDTFTAVIHENESLCDVQRFHYLNLSLKGAAARIIQSLGVSEANYRLAWELLMSRYENATDLKRHHLNSLIDLKSIQKQSEGMLREFIDDAISHRNALKSLGEPVDSSETFIVPLLARKLDTISIREWEKKISSHSQMPSFAKFSEFFEERSKYLCHVAINTQVPVQRVHQRPRMPGSQRVNAVTSHVVHTNSCPVCKGTHAIYQCDKFKTLDANGKTMAVQESPICYNCLQSGHRVKACTRSLCKICNRKQHSLLHHDDIHSVKPANSNGVVTTEFDPKETQPLVAHVVRNSGTCTMLSIAIVYIKDHKGHAHECRVLLDSGS
ncbi:uncharacterized protein LOC114881298 [Osmia bicornis bicornis]|uniref:uncharacterized protein LOC114881298 n=1 Tax=Osmia bicornis bicornis TaxID=1437191 RepID=UPI001EAED514|nr:uncharacterized protein LOC114881298 [Osmia bicornis bicornis]